jgi:hypothetical protein
MEKRGTLIDYWWESQRDRGLEEDQDEGGWIILKRILDGYDGIVWLDCSGTG